MFSGRYIKSATVQLRSKPANMARSDREPVTDRTSENCYR